MAAQGTTNAEKISRWKLLEGRLRDQLPTQPHLVEAHAELQLLIGQAEELELMFEMRRRAFLDTSEKRKEAIQAGEELRARLGGALYFKLGPKSKSLQEFGLKPRRGGRKAKPNGEEAPAPAPEGPKAVQAEVADE